MASGTAGRNDAMVRDFLAAWERRDTGHIMACWADDGVYHAIPRRPIVGRAAFREFVTRFEQVPGGRLEIHHQVASDDVVMNERTDRITFRGRQLVVPSVRCSRSGTGGSPRGASTSTPRCSRRRDAA